MRLLKLGKEAGDQTHAERENKRKLRLIRNILRVDDRKIGGDSEGKSNLNERLSGKKSFILIACLLEGGGWNIVDSVIFHWKRTQNE